MTVRGYNYFINGQRDNYQPTPADTYTFTGLGSETSYEIQAQAVDWAGNVSEKSEKLIASTTAFTTSDEPIDANRAALIDEVMVRYYRKFNPGAGAICHITSPWGYYRKAYGSTWQRAMTLDDHFRMGSISKVFTAMLILKQVELGHLGLDDTINNYVYGLPNGDRVTIRMLLRHRTGYVDPLSNQSLMINIALYGPSIAWSLNSALNMIRSAGTYFQPDAAHLYSNANYMVLTAVLEELDRRHGTGRPGYQIFNEDICEPMGLTQTSWPPDTSLPKPYSLAKWANPIYAIVVSIPIIGGIAAALLGITPLADSTFFNPQLAQGAGCLVTNMADLQAFAKKLRDGEFLDAESHYLMEETNMSWIFYEPNGQNGPGALGYSFGLMHVGSWYGHTGSAIGTNSMMFYEKNTGSTICLMKNGGYDNDLLGAVYELATMLLPETMAVPFRQKVRLDSGIASAAAFGNPRGVFVDHEPGDEDGKTDVDLKVPFYL